MTMPMNKQALLEFVHSLPDDVEVRPTEYAECCREEGEWQRVPAIDPDPLSPPLYTQRVDNLLTLRLRFTTQFVGEFERTRDDPLGIFKNVHRVR